MAAAPPTFVPPAPANAVTRCERRHRVVQAVRSHFVQAGFLEVDTAVCVRAPAPELYIDAPQVTLQAMGQTHRRYLQTSPELPMKRLLSAGLTQIFQFAAVFRDGDHSCLHRPEFRLLEWYRRGAGYQVLFDDCEGLLRGAALAAGHPPGRLNYRGRTLNLEAPFVRLSVEAAFQKYVGFSILESLSPAVLRARLLQVGIAHTESDSWDDLFHRAYLAHIEPALCQFDQPVFLTEFPTPLAALAQCCPADPRTAERFELFVCGMELANAFGELTCATTQRQRFVAEAGRRGAAGKQVYPLDEAFLQALESLPPSAGIALGVDRLLMLLFHAADMDEVAALPWQDT
jgi:lysyl-tRNA synthetase class 2